MFSWCHYVQRTQAVVSKKQFGSDQRKTNDDSKSEWASKSPAKQARVKIIKKYKKNKFFNTNNDDKNIVLL